MDTTLGNQNIKIRTNEGQKQKSSNKNNKS